MEEIIIKDNMTGLRIYINGIPEVKQIPKEEADSVIKALELQISEFYKSKHNNNKISKIK